jgi:hypothetical protein
MKVMFVLWPKLEYSPVKRRETILDICQQELEHNDIDVLVADIDDEYSQVKSPAPKFYAGPAMVGLVSVTLKQADAASQLAIFERVGAQFEQAGFTVGQYTVDESIYKDYGDNEHFRKRDWADGNKTPDVVLAVTLLTRPKKYALAEWLRRWHGIMSPGSEVIQPRARYVRNVVLSVKDGSPSFDGIVEESWPSENHIRDPYKFYLAKNPLQLAWHIIKMLRLVTQFHQLHKIRTVTMSEYFIKTRFDEDAG